MFGKGCLVAFAALEWRSNCCVEITFALVVAACARKFKV